MDEPVWCAWCRKGHAPADYCEGLVRARLTSLLVWRRRGLRRAGDLNGLLELADIEAGFRTAAAAGVITERESNVLVLRLIMGLGRRQAAALIDPDPETGTRLSVDQVKRATRDGAKKIAAWLGGLDGGGP